MTIDPLIDVDHLAGWVTQATPVTVLDVRWRMTGPAGAKPAGAKPAGAKPAGGGPAGDGPMGGHAPGDSAGAAEFAAGHLPGAVHLDLDSELCGPSGPGGRHPLPDPARLEAVLRAAGVRQDRPVVVYDAGLPDPTTWSAARTWWTLRWAGHDQVYVLDGGYAAWVAAGHPISTTPADPIPGDVTVRPGGLPVLDAAGAAALATEGVLLDVRAPARFRGETEPIDPVAGRVPGARNLPATQLLAPDGRHVDPGQVRAALAGLGADQPQVPLGAYCGSGVTAAQVVLALHRVGREDAALYVGSWSHWITDAARPVAKGAP